MDGDDDDDDNENSGGMNPLAIRIDSLDSTVSEVSKRETSVNSVTGTPHSNAAKAKGFISTTGNAKKDKLAREKANKRENLKSKAAELLEKRRAKRASETNAES